ncbi:cytochrome P460 family protein [Chryseobacterium sp. B21-037]|uniref:hypothetical protein n=1 Tax=unclassified Chryseobacterium TaxID=2593645 RepID=UPI002359B102|nr:MULTISPECIES: hypothetical protein [unclassified Chryseobacterium]MDC8104400.1 cytochrome P460 family protein [Chryseobacterium sp. B21-037]MDQ1804015.1 hypothetical protein [Chryseobacterium sp. CKR4-1]
MNKIIIAMIGSFLFLISCKTENSKDKEHVRLVFDAGGLQFIASSLNTKKETMSALYGNSQALQSLSNKNDKPLPGTKMKLVTWKYHENPQYTGGTITGELVSVETVENGIKGSVSYRKELDNEKEPGIFQTKEQRIQYMMGYQPVVMP